MSPELETLDQLLAGNLVLTIIQRIFPDSETFMRGVLGLLTSGDVRLLEIAPESEVPSWRWRELFMQGGVMQMLDHFELQITDQGTTRIT